MRTAVNLILEQDIYLLLRMLIYIKDQVMDVICFLNI